MEHLHSIEEIREIWDGYDRDYCHNCFYNAICSQAKSGGFCDDYGITPHVGDNGDYTDTELLTGAGKDIQLLLDVLDGSLTNQVPPLQNYIDLIVLISDIEERWSGYDKTFCGCFYDRLNYERKNGRFCDVEYGTNEEHLDDDDVYERLIYAGVHIHTLLEAIEK